jgi:hypothetical protein
MRPASGTPRASPSPWCSVHQEPLVEEVHPGDHLDPESGGWTLIESQFPHAVGQLTEDGRRLCCASCRAAEARWIGAPGDMASKAAWLRLGYDPYRGRGVQVPDAELVSDYVWIEKRIRALDALGLLAYTVDTRGFETVDEYILHEASIARAENAPLDVTHRRGGRWVRLEETGPDLLRGALGLEPSRG